MARKTTGCRCNVCGEISEANVVERLRTDSWFCESAKDATATAPTMENGIECGCGKFISGATRAGGLQDTREVCTLCAEAGQVSTHTTAWLLHECDHFVSEGSLAPFFACDQCSALYVGSKEADECMCPRLQQERLVELFRSGLSLDVDDGSKLLPGSPARVVVRILPLNKAEGTYAAGAPLHFMCATWDRGAQPTPRQIAHLVDAYVGAKYFRFTAGETVTLLGDEEIATFGETSLGPPLAGYRGTLHFKVDSTVAIEDRRSARTVV